MKNKKIEEAPPKLTVTVGQLLYAQEGFKALARATGLPAVDGFRLGVLIAAVDPLLMAAQTQRRKLYEKYGELNPKTRDVTVPPEKMPALQEELTPMLEESVEVNTAPLSVELLTKVEGLTPGQLAVLVPFVR